MRFLSWNVNGIRAISKKEVLGKKDFLKWLKKESPDALCLQETKANPDQLTKEVLEPKGYSSYWSSAEKKGYSGVVTYLKGEPAEVYHGIGIDKFDSEGRVVATDLGEVVLFNVYFPNGKRSPERLDYKMEFYEEFLKHIESVRAKGKGIVVCGDVNTAHEEIDLARPKQNKDTSGFLQIERDWITKLLDAGYIDTFRMFESEGEHYTWWDYVTRARSRNVGWRIDYFFINAELKDKLKDAFILSDVMGSDHCPIGIELDV